MVFSPRTRTNLARQPIVIALICLGIAVAIFALPALDVRADLTQGTVADFNSGTFYHTGLTKTTNGGGDGDGEVRLMTVGISAAEWRSDGNVTGLGPLQGHAAVQKNGRIYVSGGGTPGSLNGTTTVSYTTILSTTNHNLTSWTGTSSLPSAIKHHGMAAVGSYLYVIGGQVGLVPTSTVSYAPINSNGALGNWASTFSLPDIRSDFATVVVSDTIYVIGGGGTLDNPQTTVYYAKPIANGNITSWSTTTASLPRALKQLTAVVYNGRIYIVGGYDGTTYYPDVYYATPDSSGNISTWVAAGQVSQQSIVLAYGVSFGGQVYIAGGAYSTSGTPLNTVASNLLNEDGTPSNWVNSDVLSLGRIRTAAVTSDDGWLYVIEGNPGTGGDPLHTIDFGPLSASGSTYTSPGTFTSDVIDLGSIQNVLSIDWNSTVTTTQASLTLQYRYGGSPDLSAVGWSAPSSAGNGFLITTTIPIGQSARFWQYKASFATTVFTSSPILNWVRLNYNQPPTITTQPSNQTVGAGQTVSFTVTATGSPPPTVQWQVSTDGGLTWTDIVGATSTTYSFTAQSSQNGNKYRAVLTNSSGSVTTNPVTLTVSGVPTPTPTGLFPDFTVSNIATPTPASQPMTQTITVSVTNQGNQGFNRTVSGTNAIVGKLSGSPRKKPVLPRTGSSAAASYFFWVEVYVDRSRPTGATDLGNCPALGGGTSYSWVYALGIGETVSVPIDCYLSPPVAPATSHTFYAQVDTCDDLSGVNCNTTSGYVLERNESNNIYPLLSTGGTGSLFLPYVIRSP